MPIDDPADAMNAQSKAFVREQRLHLLLDRIARFERSRNEASDEMKKLWLLIAKEGFDVPSARRDYLYHICKPVRP